MAVTAILSFQDTSYNYCQRYLGNRIFPEFTIDMLCCYELHTRKYVSPCAMHIIINRKDQKYTQSSPSDIRIRRMLLQHHTNIVQCLRQPIRSLFDVVEDDDEDATPSEGQTHVNDASPAVSETAFRPHRQETIQCPQMPFRRMPFQSGGNQQTARYRASPHSWTEASDIMINAARTTGERDRPTLENTSWVVTLGKILPAVERIASRYAKEVSKPHCLHSTHLLRRRFACSPREHPAARSINLSRP